MAKAKGIRVNQLAKELGIPSKAILDRIKSEGLGDKVPNHMSLMSLGLAETVREWFASNSGGLATAVESDVAVKSKPVRRRKKTEAEEGASEEGTADAAGQTEAAEEKAAAETHPAMKAPSAEAPTAEAPSAPAEPVAAPVAPVEAPVAAEVKAPVPGEAAKSP
ncbi:MAG: hypothetical protein ACM359_18955, partial [Bacillota bacterium]